MRKEKNRGPFKLNNLNQNNIIPKKYYNTNKQDMGINNKSYPKKIYSGNNKIEAIVIQK